MDKDTECSTVQKEHAPDICFLMPYGTHYIHIMCICTEYTVICFIIEGRGLFLIIFVEYPFMNDRNNFT